MLIVGFFTNSLGHFEKALPFQRYQLFQKVQRRTKRDLEALKEGSSAKEKAKVEKMGKPEPKAKPFPYHLTAAARAAKAAEDAKAARSQDGGSSGSGQRARSPLPRLPKPEAAVSSGVHWTEQVKDDKLKIKHMPGETIEQHWIHYIHREPLNGYESSSSSSSSSYDPILFSNEASSSKDRGNPQGSI